MTRRNQTVLEVFFRELEAWGFLEQDPGPPPRWRRTALGEQQARFREAPQDEPGFLAAWLTACLHRYPRLDDPALWNGRDGGDPVVARVRDFMETEARVLYPLAKAGDVRRFHRQWVALTRPEADAAP